MVLCPLTGPLPFVGCDPTAYLDEFSPLTSRLRVPISLLSCTSQSVEHVTLLLNGAGDTSISPP